MNDNIFYTYAYLREDLTPYYIGKGKSYRAYRKNRNVHPPEDKTRIIFLKKNLTEEEAFRHEKYMIAIFGRKDLETGILHNRTDGGDGASGTILSQETRDKIGNYWRGRKRPGHGEKIRKSQSGTKRKPLSAEHKEKLKGRISPMKGKHLSDEPKQKISQAKKGKPWTDARKNAQIARNKNDYNQ